MRGFRVGCLAAMGAMLLASPCRADRLLLPLQGYFHPGRAMPVQWDLPGANASIDLSADGAMSVRVDRVSSSVGVLPWLAVEDDVGNVRWRAGGAAAAGFDRPLHALDDSDRLVGTNVDDPSLLKDLFGSSRVVPIRLDTMRPIAGPAMAWESLDALLVTPVGWVNIPPDLRRGLYAANVALAVVSVVPPDDALSWRKQGRLWVAQVGIALPPTVDSQAYAPTLGWTAGRSAAFRRRVVILGALFCILAGGVYLWRSRWMPAAMVLLVAAFVAAATWDNRSRSPLAQIVGEMRLMGPSDIADTWLYQISHRDADFSIPIGGLIHPVASDPQQWPSLNLVLHCSADGQPRWLSGHLKADQPLAVMTRWLAPADHAVATTRATSPMRVLMGQSIYADFSVAGQAGGGPDRWPTIILRPRAAP